MRRKFGAHGLTASLAVVAALVDYVIVKRFAGISLAFYYAIALCALLWWALAYTSIRRRLLFVGRGRSVSQAQRSCVGRVRVGGLMGSAALAALAGVLYARTSGGADPSSGSTRLQLMGVQSFVQQLLYGGALLVAVALSQLVRGRVPLDNG